ncbi:MAG: hypothetical protein COA79_20895 [Planctomycetota bacterium]|nr:MAG: hypothetical protein COA79_20895 [Planctomycetota bacterium]
MKILVVDDNKHIVEMLAKYLSTRHNISSFVDPEEALEYYKGNSEVDVVITDFEMPNMNGDELIKKIFYLNPNQSFILISGYFTHSLKEVLKKSNAYIQMIDKPFENYVLDNALESIEKLNLSCRRNSNTLRRITSSLNN